ncbi:MAG: prenyltransferase/squalene oxidase repeat-containing protein [Lentisphaeria bacterium]|nr:prenyltransferase/squalene oxidase repeat-containing protein [Lentisphaeria bacterium]
MTCHDYQRLSAELLRRRLPSGDWSGHLAPSAVSTATAAISLALAAPDRHAKTIAAACQWLADTQLADGAWGDTPESPPNLTASLLGYAALAHADADSPAATRARTYLTARLGGFSPAAIRAAILEKYGQDLTFSVPILALCTASDLLHDDDHPWSRMPQLPFELALLPRACFRFLNLRVVSYALPALIAIGVAQATHARPGLPARLRRRLIPAVLRLLTRLQPPSGGFLEAAPLTAFCLICLSAANLRAHPVALAAERFLTTTVRPDGAWPIDTSLAQWCTALAAKAAAPAMTAAEREDLADIIRQRQFAAVHPFTGAAPGGWAWTHQSGAVPDADDTAAALVALHALQPDRLTPEIADGCAWLINLQNRDGGIPTFCRGWGKLPFDRSCPDLSAHAYHALDLWRHALQPDWRHAAERCQKRILDFLSRNQRADGAFLPLWFGDQLAPDGLAPVYGTAVVLENLCGLATPWSAKARDYLLAAQLPSGAWGADDRPGATPRFIFTARAIAALATGHDTGADTRQAIQRGLDFLRTAPENLDDLPPEPVGLYFSQLWYSEQLYPRIFITRAFLAAGQYQHLPAPAPAPDQTGTKPPPDHGHA